jgi:hypothetical protein
MNDQPSTPERRVSYVDIPPPITPLNARVTQVGDINIDPVIKNPLPSQNQTVEYVPVNLFENGDFGGRKKRTKKHRRGKKTKRTNKKTRRFFRFGGMDPFVTPPNSPPRLRMPPPVIRAPRVNTPPAGVFQGQNLMAQFDAIDNRDEEGYTDSEDMTGGAYKRPRSYTTSSENRRDVKKPKYSSTENSSTENSSTETISGITSRSSSLGSLTTQFGETNITSSMSSDKDMSATNGNTKGGYRRKTKRRTSRKRRATRK